MVVTRHLTPFFRVVAQNAVLHCNRAAALLALKSYTEALRDIDAALSLDPSWSKAAARRGSILLAMGHRAEDAAHAFEKALHFDATNTAARDGLARARAQMSGGGEGADFAEESIADALDAKANGNDAFGARDYPVALARYTEATLAAPEHAVMHSNRAAAFLALGCFRDAERSAKRCVALDPTFVKGYTRAAEALRLLGCPSEAKRVLREGLDRNGEDATLTRALHDLLSPSSS